jgi:hypothetical protein
MLGTGKWHFSGICIHTDIKLTKYPWTKQILSRISNNWIMQQEFIFVFAAKCA